jgi:hypothetical protein
VSPSNNRPITANVLLAFSPSDCLLLAECQPISQPSTINPTPINHQPSTIGLLLLGSPIFAGDQGYQYKL